ncbi:hypothetical protein DFH07DRAFT_780641 [Mycena maculata]|uniref:Uncharacterized protein n=1 Tax=Mycena maculata TaxID=230809 RepID=A0AAD7MV68_9AGAR|nr:hypothetical protein DFH07DRAFT_780641 [Mycena maculata]
MTLTLTLRSLGAPRTLLKHTRSMHSPFGAMSPRAAPSTHTHSAAQESGARINVVASAPIDKFNGVPLGAYQISTPYHPSIDGQTGQETGQETHTKQEAHKEVTSIGLELWPLSAIEKLEGNIAKVESQTLVERELPSTLIHITNGKSAALDLPKRMAFTKGRLREEHVRQWAAEEGPCVPRKAQSTSGGYNRWKSRVEGVGGTVDVDPEDKGPVDGNTKLDAWTSGVGAKFVMGRDQERKSGETGADASQPVNGFEAGWESQEGAGETVDVDLEDKANQGGRETGWLAVDLDRTARETGTGTNVKRRNQEV